MNALTVTQIILNDLIFFILGGVLFDQVPDWAARITRVVRARGKEESAHDRNKRHER